MAVCFIIPPHILREIARRGSEEQKKRAEHSLMISQQIREKRSMFLGNQPHLPTGRQAPNISSIVTKNRIIYTADDTTDLPGDKLRVEGQGPTDDAAADQAYFGTGATFDLYAHSYQRNSIDNQGMNLISTFHYSQKYDNAFWDGEQMVYGDGGGDLFALFTKPIDVTGHELTRGVTQYSANLDYQGQSGALNESFSDVFGSLVKQQVLHQTADTADWLIGEGIFTSRAHGQALRSMKAPGTAYDGPIIGKDPQPATMAAFVKTADDNGGVHLNSGIPNHAFYLAATGIGGYTWEGAGKIWYETLTTNLQKNASFADCANATIATARTLFGNGGKEEKAVREAWKQVGVI